MEVKNGFGGFGVGSEFSLYLNNCGGTVLDPFQDPPKMWSLIQDGYMVFMDSE